MYHDIKPANLIVHADVEKLILVNFGDSVSGVTNNRNTVQCYGIPSYAVPEHYQGHSSPHSDVYGLAATLYHLLTGDAMIRLHIHLLFSVSALSQWMQ